MGILAWIILGLIVGYIASWMVSAQDTQNIIVICLLGVGGALIGGFLAVVFNVASIGGFFSAAAWIAAVVGSVVLLLLYRMLIVRPSVHR